MIKICQIELDKSAKPFLANLKTGKLEVININF